MATPTPSIEPELLSAYLDDEVTPAERSRVEAALRNSPALAAELEALRVLAARVGAIPREAAPVDFAAEYLRSDGTPRSDFRTAALRDEPERAEPAGSAAQRGGRGIIRLHRATLALSSAALVAISSLAGWMAHRYSLTAAPIAAPEVAARPQSELKRGDDASRDRAEPPAVAVKDGAKVSDLESKAEGAAAPAVAAREPEFASGVGGEAKFGDARAESSGPPPAPADYDARESVADVTLEVAWRGEADANAKLRSLEALSHALAIDADELADRPRGERVVEASREQVAVALGLVNQLSDRTASVRVSGDYETLAAVLPEAQIVNEAAAVFEERGGDEAAISRAFGMEANRTERSGAAPGTATSTDTDSAVPAAAPVAEPTPTLSRPGSAAPATPERSKPRPPGGSAATRGVSPFADPALADEREFLRIVAEMKQAEQEARARKEAVRAAGRRAAERPAAAASAPAAKSEPAVDQPKPMNEAMPVRQQEQAGAAPGPLSQIKESGDATTTKPAERPLRVRVRWASPERR